MGAAVTRAIRNFNLENRAEREISRMKPSAAPRHPSTKNLLREQMSSHPEIKGEIARKDDKLLSLLKDVYVDSKDPVSFVQVILSQVKMPFVIWEFGSGSQEKGRGLRSDSGVKDAGTPQKPKEFRLPKDHHSDMMNVKNIPKGKISIVEALTLLNNHKLYPDTWTAEKIAEEYHLDQQDVNSLLKYFVTFEVKILPPEGKKAIQSK
ncbi:hypothetical protein J1605_008144 [Eschrichtius robustus]|uniref:NADH dehydrogenase [ubiquinone] 1 alpha subcomplex assembly factor 4 n=1 Tax=Eschrichtius robustus TaxID=9764 RepID=A0AB34GZX5_ESCRO|nr:hypothetical protein J1605_008144 [Eschrichtius robustus]